MIDNFAFSVAQIDDCFFHKQYLVVDICLVIDVVQLICALVVDG